MKSYTDLEQSKKLAEILPIESADMYYFTIIHDYPYSQGKIKTIVKIMDGSFSSDYDTPCWSLAALLDVLQKTAYFIDEDANVMLCSYKTVEWHLGINNSDVEFITKTNTIDACYEMIVKLHELNCC